MHKKITAIFMPETHESVKCKYVVIIWSISWQLSDIIYYSSIIILIFSNIVA